MNTGERVARAKEHLHLRDVYTSESSDHAYNYARVGPHLSIAAGRLTTPDRTASALRACCGLRQGNLREVPVYRHDKVITFTTHHVATVLIAITTVSQYPGEVFKPKAARLLSREARRTRVSKETSTYTIWNNLIYDLQDADPVLVTGTRPEDARLLCTDCPSQLLCAMGQCVPLFGPHCSPNLTNRTTPEELCRYGRHP